MVKKIALVTGILVVLGLATAAVLAGTGDAAGLAQPGPDALPESGEGAPAAVAREYPIIMRTPTPAPTPAVSRFVARSERVFVVTVGPEPAAHIDADRALQIASRNGGGQVGQALRTTAYLLRVGDLRVRRLTGNYPRALSNQQAMWMVVYEGIPWGDRYQTHTVWLDAVTGTPYGSEERTAAQAGKLASSPFAIFDPPGLSPLVLLTPTPRPRQPTPAIPYPVALTAAERQLTVDIALRDPVVQRATSQQPYEMRMVYGWQDPLYGRVGKATIYLQNTAVSYAPAVDLANKRVVFQTVPIISAPGQMVALTDQEGRLARDIAYASALVKEKTAGRTLQGDYTVGYLNRQNGRMAIVLVYIAPELTYQPIVDLTNKRVISTELKEIVAFRRPEPAPWRLLTPTPVKATPTAIPPAKPPYPGWPGPPSGLTPATPTPTPGPTPRGPVGRPK